MIIIINGLLAEMDYRYGLSRAIWPDGSQLEIKNTKDSLDLAGAQINYLPHGLTIGGYLDLYGTPIVSLREGLKVGGSLNLRGTQITSLPDDLQIGGNIYLRGTTITKSQVPKYLKDKCIW